MTEGRGLLSIRLNQQLGTLVSSVKIGIQNNLSLFNIVAETTLAELLNRIHGWTLVNANSIRQNHPGVDLIDPKQKIAVQVTSTRKVDKVRNTLDKTGRLDDDFEKLIILVITHEPPTKEMKNCALPGNVKHMDIWSISDVLQDALVLSAEKLKEITDFLDLELGSVKAAVAHLPHLELPPQGALPPSGFVGREEELAEIRRRFDSGDKEVCLTGLGGMGKTELAIHYGQNHRGTVHLIRFSTDFQGTLAKMAHSIRPRLTEKDLSSGESNLAKKVLALLEQSGEQDVLIIDNVDSDKKTLAELQEDPCFEALKKLSLRLLMTTRSDVPRAIRVARMSDDPLFEIFRNHGAELSEEEMRKLIRAVNGHTLTVDLIARTLADNWVPVSAPEMLDAITEATLREEDFPEVGTDYNGDPEQLHIYQRLRGVFQVAKIPPTEQQLLRLATLLPEVGMDVRLFRKALSPELLKVFPGLGRRGWLSADHQVLTIHPVIRLVCRTEQPLTEEDCEAFLDKLWEQYDPTQYLSDHYSQMAELFTIAHDRLGKHHGRWLNRAGILLNELVQYQKLHDLYHLRLPEVEKTLPSNSTELATVYNYYGIALTELGHYDSALTYSRKALGIRQAVLPEDDADLARSYNNVGDAFGDLGNHQQALEYKQKALEIFQKVLPEDHPDLAKSYNHLGSTYNNLGNHQKALEYLLKALAILEKALPLEPPNLAITYHNIGSIYADLGNHRKALEYLTKALAIQKKALPPEHPLLARSCNNIAWTYHDLGDLIQAAQFMHRAADIIQRSGLPKTHPDRIDFPKWATEFEKKAEMQRRLLSQPMGWNPNPFPFGKK